MNLKSIKTILTQENLQSYLDELQQKKSLFTKPMMAVLIFVLNRNLKKAEAFRLKFYKFNDIKLYNFVECLVNKDFTYLYKSAIKKRNLIAEQLQWAEIITAYSEKIASDFEYQDIIDFYNTLAKIRILEASIPLLNRLSNESKTAIKKIGIKLTGNCENDYMIIIGKLSTFKRQITELSEKLEAVKANSEALLTFEFFHQQIIRINEVLNANYSLYSIRAGEYCELYKTFKQRIECQKKQSLK